MFEAVITLVSVTALLLGSPGPAPIALSASGATYGVRNSVPFLCGILSGLSFAIIGAAVGLALLLATFPKVAYAVQLLGAIYVLYIAYKIATAPFLALNADGLALAPTFWDGFILNLLNPKAYAAFFAIFSQFQLPVNNAFSSELLTGLVCLAVAAVVDVVWLLMGGLIRPVLSSPKKSRIVRVSMSVSMVVVVAIALVQQQGFLTIQA
ncbi:MAG: LysE family transporter [Pseudomonadales bacterium]|nr:LysE family transporter [Pseudomonadales bacterium]